MDLVYGDFTGAPHLRERVFIVAYPHSDGSGQSSRIFVEDSGGVGDHLQLNGQAVWNCLQIDRAGPVSTWLASAGCGVRRVDDGSAEALDRLKGLGNDITPQQSEYVGRLILADMKRLTQ
jgi:hypothetical protein